MRIGFIGLGIMGKPMAKNLIKAGHELTVYDIFEAPVKELVEAGAKAASSPKDVAAQNELIITMLPNSPHVKTAVLGMNGVIEGAATALGKPRNLSNSGSVTIATAPMTGPHGLPAPPMITIDKIKIDSITVKLLGSMNLM
jgi:hypothetical protein